MTKEEIEYHIRTAHKTHGESEAIDWIKAVADRLHSKYEHDNKALIKENSKLVQTVAEWSALEIDRKQDIDALLKEVDKWKQDHKDLLDIYIKADEEITNLKKQLQEKEREVEGLREGIKTVLENPTTKSEGENVKHIFDEEIKILEQLLNPNT